jgi:hypothetical protein
MYGLPQVGIIAQELLAKRLKEHGYTQSKTMPWLWTQEWRPITFSPIIDNFGVKYIEEEYVQHLLQMVQKKYTCLFGKEGERYCGLTIKCDYVGKKVHLLMPTHAEEALKCFQHLPPIVPQDQPHQHIKKMYGEKFKQANPLDTSPLLNKAGKKFIQEVMGVSLYLARAVDSTMLTALSSIASKQAAPIEKTMKKMPTILRLRSITRGHNHHISSKQHGTRNTQQRIVPIRIQGPQQSLRPHVHGRH